MSEPITAAAEPARVRQPWAYSPTTDGRDLRTSYARLMVRFRVLYRWIPR